LFQGFLVAYRMETNTMVCFNDFHLNPWEVALNMKAKVEIS
jgi:hypothetical protein